MRVAKFAMTFTLSHRLRVFSNPGGNVKDNGEEIDRFAASLRERCCSVTLHLAPAGVHLHNEIISFRPRMES